VEAGSAVFKQVVETATQGTKTEQVAIFNMGDRDAEFAIAAASGGFKRATVERLKAAAIDAKQGVTFQGSVVTGNGQFHPRHSERLKSVSGKIRVSVPRYSAALLRLE
jgi:hypothetical protein